MDEPLELEDLLANPIPDTTQDFQAIVTSRFEFASKASSARESQPSEPGKLFTHQELMVTYLKSHDRLMDISEPGSGKTCPVIAYAEYAKQQSELAKINPGAADPGSSHFKRTYALVGNDAGRENFLNQLACNCTPRAAYLTDAVLQAQTPKQQLSAIRKQAKKWYGLRTYYDLAKHVRTFDDTEAGNRALAEEYSDCIFWIDEAQNLTTDMDLRIIPGTNLNKQQIYAALWRLFHVAQRIKIIMSTATPMINNSRELINLLNILLPTVMPANLDYVHQDDNFIRTFFPRWSLPGGSVLPLEQRARISRADAAKEYVGQIPANFNMQAATANDMEPYLRGHINYVRGLETGAKAMYAYNPELPIPMLMDQHTVPLQPYIYTCLMSEHQRQGYEASRAGDDVFTQQRQSSNLVFPDGSWGRVYSFNEVASRSADRENKARERLTREIEADQEYQRRTGLPVRGPATQEELREASSRVKSVRTGQMGGGFSRYVIKGEDDTFAATPEFASILRSMDNIRRMSCKYAKCLELTAPRNPNGTFQAGSGSSFIYSEFYNGSGSIALSLCYEAQGFARFRARESIFVGTAGKRGVCATSGMSRRPLQASVMRDIQSGQPRYAILTSKTSAAEYHNILEAMNSWENRHGDIIKVLIVSKIGRVAINIHNVLRVILLGPEFTESNSKQAISRGIRVTGHDDLIRERLAAGITDPLIIPLYRLCAVTTANYNPPSDYAITWATDGTPQIHNLEAGSDIHMYRLAQAKNRDINIKMRILKECAITCHIHRERNVRPGDVDGSEACDFQECDYKCYSPKLVDPETNEPIYDYSTYDVRYAQEKIDTIVDVIKRDVFTSYNNITLPELRRLLYEYRGKYTLMAVDDMITNKLAIVDSFGFVAYLYEDGDTYYLDRGYPRGVKGKYSMNYYSSDLIGVVPNTLYDIVTQLQITSAPRELNTLQQMDPQSPEFARYYARLDVPVQVKLLEDALLARLTGKPVTPAEERIMGIDWAFIFGFPRPSANLRGIFAKAYPDVRSVGKPLSDLANINYTIHFPGEAIGTDKSGATKLYYDFEEDDSEPYVYVHSLNSLERDLKETGQEPRINSAAGDLRILDLSGGIEQAEWVTIENVLEQKVYRQIIQYAIRQQDEAFRRDIYLRHGNRYGGGQVYGKIDPYSDKLRFIDKTHEGEEANLKKKLKKTGQTCIHIQKAQIYSVMWALQMPLPYGIDMNSLPPPYQMADAIRNLDTSAKLRNELNISNWSLAKLQYVFALSQYHTRQKTGSPGLCNEMRNFMLEHNLIINRYQL